MPSPYVVQIEVSEQEQQVLEHIVNERNQPQGLVKRSQIILAAAAGRGVSQSATELGRARMTVQLWRTRWQQTVEQRATADSPKALRARIEVTLRDADRSGSPGKFSPEQMVQIVAVACEDPSASSYPVSHWTPQAVAEEVMKRGIVEQISVRQVGRFLKRG